MDIQPATKASAQDVAVVDHLVHLVDLSTMVITCVWPSELAVRGLTRST